MLATMPITPKRKRTYDFTSTVRYQFLKRLMEWCEDKPGEGTPNVSSFWLIVGGQERISWRCFYELHYKKLRDEGYLMDYTDPNTGARALLITAKSRNLF